MFWQDVGLTQEACHFQSIFQRRSCKPLSIEGGLFYQAAAAAHHFQVRDQFAAAQAQVAQVAQAAQVEVAEQHCHSPFKKRPIRKSES